MTNKNQLINDIAQSLLSYGYTVYLAESGEYGFYTDGTRCVSFGGNWNFCVDYSGNYISSKSGTGWSIAKKITPITEAEANAYIKASAPWWTTEENVRYTTPEQYLKTYGASSGYSEFKG